ncbi:hypothetical protein Rhal01_03822 [Rubritalea halochordaticola]|uniref:DUF1376 domain-containing protein n=1 Tax=Rubritalea halochordaticola TaxID=714537 RepID=A0ABP9V4M6_9BACT
MAREAAPAFQFYPKDYLCSDSVMEMSLAAQGVYARLLCKCWLSGSIPADPRKAARLIGYPDAWEEVQEALGLFYEDAEQPGRMRHSRLDEEREKQRKYSEKRARAARARWAKQSPPADDEPGAQDQESGQAEQKTGEGQTEMTKGANEQSGGDAYASDVHAFCCPDAVHMECSTSSSPTTIVVEREKKKRRRRAPKESDCEVYARSRAPDEWKEFAGSVGREFYGVYAGQDWYKQTGEDLLSNKKWKYVLQVRLEAELRKENERGKRYTQRKKHAASDRKTGGSSSPDKQPQRDKAGAGISVRSL